MKYLTFFLEEKWRYSAIIPYPGLEIIKPDVSSWFRHTSAKHESEVGNFNAAKIPGFL